MWISTAVILSKPCLSQSESEIAKSFPILCNPMDCSPPGSSVHGIFQALSPTLKMTAASNTAIWQGSTFVASEVSGGRSQMTEALGRSSGTWLSKGQLWKAPWAPLQSRGMRKCCRLVDTPHNCNTETSAAGRGMFRRPGGCP